MADDDENGGQLVEFPVGGAKKKRGRRKRDDESADAAANAAAAWEMRKELDAAVSRLVAVCGADADPLDRLAAELDAARQTLATHARLGYGVDAKDVAALQKVEGLLNRRRLFTEARALTIEGAA